MHVSPRGIPLLWQGTIDIPVVTLENYEKWYSVFVVHPSGLVEKVPPEIIGEMAEKTGENLWIDHDFHPLLLEMLAEHYSGEANQTALEIAAGRWVMEGHSLEAYLKTR